jgi:phosphatidate cytidylyltransferase
LALSPSLKTLLTRAFSAVTAVLVVLSLYYFFELNGLRFICYFSIILGGRELTRLLFENENSALVKSLFFTLIIILFSLSSHFPDLAGLVLALVFAFFCGTSLLRGRSEAGLEGTSTTILKGLLGLVYLGLAPSFAYRLLGLSHGLVWFSSLLIIIFAGDTSAYLVGLKLGQTKLMPSISPKKTVEGAVGGLIGSILAVLILSQWLPSAPIWYLTVMGACVGVVAQFGDLFESLLKRLANRKDSGSLMPGHGGVLDRLDGVLFAAPIMFFFAQLVEKHLI